MTRRMKQEVVAIAVIGIVGWLLAFAVHLHLPGQQSETGQQHLHHACLLCAAFQPGAGPPSALPTPERGQLSRTEFFVSIPVPPSCPRTVYRSRAPPNI